jgi:hypothetical protein
MMSKIVCGFLFLIGVISLLGGCASQPEDPNKVSTIPWNRPEKWEGPGVLGSQLNPNQ